MLKSFRRVAAPLAIAFLLLSTLAWAEAQDYRFEAVTPKVKSGKNALIDVRLVHVPTGKPVENAVIFRTRLDMAPEGMAEMTTKTTTLKSDQVGVHRFQADLGMAGSWALTLQAKVPGETETVQGMVKVDATK